MKVPDSTNILLQLHAVSVISDPIFHNERKTEAEPLNLFSRDCSRINNNVPMSVLL